MATPSKTKLQRFITQPNAMKNDPDYAIFEAGINEGRRQMRNQALTFLEKKYLGADAPDRDTPEAKAILSLAHELSEELKI